MTIEEANQKLKELREEYVKAPMSKREIIRRQARCFQIIIDRKTSPSKFA